MLKLGTQYSLLTRSGMLRVRRLSRSFGIDAGNRGMLTGRTSASLLNIDESSICSLSRRTDRACARLRSEFQKSRRSPNGPLNVEPSSLEILTATMIRYYADRVHSGNKRKATVWCLFGRLFIYLFPHHKSET